jgi:hypothetical protein
MQNLHQSTWDHEILYYDRSSEDEQLLIRQFLRETKNMKVAEVEFKKKTLNCFVYNSVILCSVVYL